MQAINTNVTIAKLDENRQQQRSEAMQQKTTKACLYNWSGDEDFKTHGMLEQLATNSWYNISDNLGNQLTSSLPLWFDQTQTDPMVRMRQIDYSLRVVVFNV